MIYITLTVLLLLIWMMIQREEKKAKMEIDKEKLAFRCKSCQTRQTVSDWLKQDYQCLNKECILGRRHRRSLIIQKQNQVKEEEQLHEVHTTVTKVKEDRGLILFTSLPQGVDFRQVEVPRSIVLHIKRGRK